MMATTYEALDLKCQMIIDDFDDKYQSYVKLKEIAVAAVDKILKGNSIEVTASEARVKGRDSLMGKLVRKGHLYTSIYDITDLVGLRIITLFNDDVDRVAAFIAKTFDVDWSHSTDKRKMHSMDSFGYNSLHYICRLPLSMCEAHGCPELHDIRFEIQMRSTLQHAWAAMEHDLGYKSDIETPPEYMRMFNRLASLLELADEEFTRLRINVTEHRRKMEALISEGKLSEVALDGDTFNTYISHHPFDKLTRKIAAINQGEIQEMSFEPFFPLLKEAGLESLQDVEDWKKQNAEDAYNLALCQFSDTDIDIIASTVGLQDLLFVTALKNGGGKQALVHIFDELNGPSPHNKALADLVYDQACNLEFMNNVKNK